MKPHNIINKMMLLLLLVIGISGNYVFAATPVSINVVETFEELQNAINNAPDNEETVIRIGADIENIKQLVVKENKNIVLTNDGTHRKLSFKETTPAVSIRKSGKLRIDTVDGNNESLILDGQNEKHTAYKQGIFFINGELVVKSGTIKNFLNNSAWAGIFHLKNSDAKLTIDGGIIKENSIINQNSGVIYSEEGGVININVER